MKVVLLGLLAIASVNADDPLCAGLPADQIVLFPSPVYCNHYYKCLNGVFTEEICEAGLYFSPSSNRCVEPEYAECNGGTGAPPESTVTSEVTTTTTPSLTTTTRSPTTTTTPTTTTSSTIPDTTTTISTGTTPDYPIDPRCSGDETSYWPHPSECRLYIECYQGASYEMSCPADKYFSDNAKECVFAEESECCAENPSKCT